MATTKTTKKAKPKKKKYSYYEKQKAIKEISQAVNESMTKKYLFDRLFKAV